MSLDAYTFRHLRTLDDYRACVALQEAVWGAGFSERVPTAILKVAQELGGVTAGAFDAGGRLNAFVFGLTGLDPVGEPVHWSDMLAVRSGAGGEGLATRLKWFQREAVLALGITRMYWTFDPLRARNAHLNLNKLGAVVREYREDMYGETDSELHRGIGTDRFVALWPLDAPRVLERAPAKGSDGTEEGPGRPHPAERPPPPPSALDAITTGGAPDPEPGRIRLDLTDARVGVGIPSDIGAVIERDPEQAAVWRTATRKVFVHYLGRGYEVVALIRGGEVATYVLESRARSASDAPPRDAPAFPPGARDAPSGEEA